MTSKEWKYIFLITVIFIAACIETDIYLPAFPDMMVFFSTSEEVIQSLLTWNFFGICISGPFYGPLSDSFGRKKPLMVALGLFLLGSIFTLFSTTFNLMLCGRVLQGLGSGGCFTLGTAIIFDTFQEKKAVEALSRLNTIVPFIMALAPMLGGYLNYAYGFRSNFIAIFIFVLLSILISFFFFEESLPKEKQKPFDLQKVFSDFKIVCTSLAYWQIVILVSLIFAGYLAFLSTASVLYVLELGVSKGAFPFHQASVLGGWVIASVNCNRAIKVCGLRKVKIIGATLLVSGALVFVLLAHLFPLNPYLFTASMSLYAFGANWSQGLYFPEGMELHPEIKGITASLLTSTRLLLTAMIVGIASYFYDGTIYPMAITILAIVSVILPTIFFYEKAKGF